jgi:hypothetical protein
MRGIFTTSAVLALGLGGCATVVEGTSQNMMIVTHPPGASCTVSRQGQQIAAVISTPGNVNIGKSKNDLAVTCTKEGFEPTTAVYSSTFNGTTFGNLILGGVAGAVIDASTGASYNYPQEVSIAMPTAVAASPAPSVAAAPLAAIPAPLAAKTTTAAAPAPKPVAASVAPASVPAAAPAPAAIATASASGVIAPDPMTRTMKPVE